MNIKKLLIFSLDASSLEPEQDSNQGPDLALEPKPANDSRSIKNSVVSFSDVVLTLPLSNEDREEIQKAVNTIFKEKNKNPLVLAVLYSEKEKTLYINFVVHEAWPSRIDAIKKTLSFKYKGRTYEPNMAEGSRAFSVLTRTTDLFGEGYKLLIDPTGCFKKINLGAGDVLPFL